jgi:outer membrane protein OmpU
MKKILFAGCALVALGAVSAQAADPISLSITGFTKEFVGIGSNKDSAIYSSSVGGSGAAFSAIASGTRATAADKRAQFDEQMDSNINFVGKTTLDNGVTVAVEVDTLLGTERGDSKANLDGNAAARRSYVTASGNFGSVVLGERENVSYVIHSSAPDVGIGIEDNTTDGKNWIVNPGRHAFFDGTQMSRFDDRADKVMYFSPNFYGVTASFSYTPTVDRYNQGHTTIASAADNSVVQPTGFTAPTIASGNGSVSGSDFGSGDLYVEGLAFNNTLGGVSIKADAEMGQLNFLSEQLYGAGAQVGYAGFTVGGGYLKRSIPDGTRFVSTSGSGSTNAAARAAGFAGQTWDVGVSYAISDYSASLSYFRDSSFDSNIGSNDTTKSVMLSGKYNMGPGIALVGSVFHMQYDNGSTNTYVHTAEKNEGWAGVTGITVNF